MTIISLIRRRAEAAVAELARAERRVGILYAVAILKPPAVAGDCEAVVVLADQLVKEARR